MIGLAFLLPLHSWQSIVAATSELALIAYALPSISNIAFQRAAQRDPAQRDPAQRDPAQRDSAGHTIGGMQFLAPAAFVLTSMILYWATWRSSASRCPCCSWAPWCTGFSSTASGASAGEWTGWTCGLGCG